ncbi:MAG: hypothetical protein WBF33_21755 [Candidatus Nitrosopolaris sp.]|jgi:hypothetical protein
MGLLLWIKQGLIRCVSHFSMGLAIILPHSGPCSPLVPRSTVGPITNESFVYPDRKSSQCGLCIPFPGVQVYALPVPSSQLTFQGAEIVELRGWITEMNCKGCANDGVNYDEGDNPYDFSYDLKLDPHWLQEKGININQIIRVGNILSNGTISTYPYSAGVAFPIVHVESMSWRNGQTLQQNYCCTLNHIPTCDLPDFKGAGVVSPPQLCGYRSIPKPQNWIHEDPPNSNPPVMWPWDPHYYSYDWIKSPHNNTAIAIGDYVRIKGALITDNPHDLTKWDYSPPSIPIFNWPTVNYITDPTNPARWTEIHPPDLIEKLPYKAPTEEVRCAALNAHPDTFNDRTTNLIFNIQAPPNPFPNVLQVTEDIDKSVSSGKLITDKITKSTNLVTVQLAVKSTHVLTTGTPGQFKACYTVSWKEIPNGLLLYDRSAGYGQFYSSDGSGGIHQLGPAYDTIEDLY